VTVLLGGDANPMGGVVQYLEATPEAVLEAIRRGPGSWKRTPTSKRLDAALPAMLPFQAPWARMLVAACGEWTAVVNNSLHGGDGTAPGPMLSHAMGVRLAVAGHSPRYGPGHAQTQLELMGPSGVPPLMYIRSISATAEDGRWLWEADGDVLDFEAVDRYSARRVKDRFDRDLLLTYLRALGIPADDDAAYGPATLLRRRFAGRGREMTLEETRADYA
jgi:hypothetical protein